MTLHAKLSGTGTDPIVLLHGFGGDHTAWREIQPALAEHRLTIAYDLPAHGGSLNYPDAGSAKTAALAVLDDFKARGIDRVHLVGHSMGGAVACLVALFDPKRVATITLLAPGGFGPDINHRLLTRYAAAENREQLTACLEAMTGWYSPIRDETVEHFLTARAVPGQRQMLIEMAKGLARDGRQGLLPLEKIAELNVPVTVVWGELDNVLPVSQLEGLPTGFAVRRLPKLGHMLPDEAPAEMTRIIRAVCGF